MARSTLSKKPKLNMQRERTSWKNNYATFHVRAKIKTVYITLKYPVHIYHKLLPMDTFDVFSVYLQNCKGIY